MYYPRMANNARSCPSCGTPAAHPTQTLCLKCQGHIPLEGPGRGKCQCCGNNLPASRREGMILHAVGGNLFRMGTIAEHSCPKCGDPSPTAPSNFTDVGCLFVGLQVLAWSILVPIILANIEGAWHLSGGKAFLAVFVMLIVLCIWTNWASKSFLLAIPLFALLTFWPFFVADPTDGLAPPNLRMQIFVVTLAVNVVAFAFLLKRRRKPFAKW